MKMNEKEKIIHKLYSALQDLDYEGMIKCYHPEATFEDPVFRLGTKNEIAGMWTMLCKRAKKFELKYYDVRVYGKEGEAQITAKYLFSQTDRMVHNQISAHFKFKDGLIIEQVDFFDFWKWSRQALGLTGLLLGWSTFLQNKVRKQADENMQQFIDAQ